MDEKIISLNIKRFRTAKKQTLQELADRTGLTKGYLSKVERSGKAPPYSTLSKIAAALAVEVTTLLSREIDPPENVRLCISRKTQRNLIPGAEQFPGYDYEVLAEKKSGKNMEPFIIHAPFEAERTYSHEGEEFIYVMDGQLEFYYGADTYILNPGDNVYFDSVIPHVGKSMGHDKTKLLVVIYFYKRNHR